jgi:serine/threonine-protein kinase
MQIGARLADRYRLEEQIGRGGMAAVWRATDELLHRQVAVKTLEIRSEDVDRSSDRFVREARATAALAHPNIVTIFDTGVDGTTAFLVMELLAGPNLRDRLAAEGPMPVDEVVGIGIQVAGALAAAHASGMVHRDVKPANIVHADTTTVKVVDFGVVRMLEETTDSFSLTATHAVIGTAAYLSPEQAAGGQVDARSDLYGLGCVLFALLTGDAPFSGESAVAVLGQHLHAAPPTVLALRPDTPPVLARLVDDLLAKDPAARPSTATEVAGRLTAMTAGTGTAVMPAPVATEETTRVLPPPPAEPPRRRLRPGVVAVVGAVVLALALGALALVALTSGDGGAPKHTGRARQSPTPTPTTTTRSPTPSPTPTPARTRPPLSTPAAAVAAFRTALARAAAAGAIDDKGAEDLTHRLDDLSKTLADPAKAKDLAHKVDDLAKHVDDLASKGQLTAEGRRLLDRPLAALQRLVG